MKTAILVIDAVSIMLLLTGLWSIVADAADTSAQIASLKAELESVRATQWDPDECLIFRAPETPVEKRPSVERNGI